ncbi:MAG: C-terminal binding protein [Dehalococcoidia bacterium]|nr:C-terminal binding protein [Dehalococcoidia bacterium]
MSKVLITDYVWPDIEAESAILRAAGIEPVVAPDSSVETLTRLAADVDAIMFCFAQVPAQVLQNAPNCKVASRYGIGVDNVDIAACTELGIVVTNVPDYCIDEVADHVMGMALSFNRKIVKHSSMVKASGWGSVSLTEPMHRLRDKTMGIAGMGRIGRAVTGRALAFGMTVLAHDPFVEQADAPEGARMTSLESMLTESDFVTLHAPLIPETTGMIGANELKLMKSDAFLINAARGPLIDEAALVEALGAGEIGGAGLDVLEETAPPDDHPLYAFDNVIITPHTAFFSQASTIELEERTAREVVRVLNGEMADIVVNPEVLGKTRAGI